MSLVVDLATLARWQTPADQQPAAAVEAETVPEVEAKTVPEVKAEEMLPALFFEELVAKRENGFPQGPDTTPPVIVVEDGEPS